MASNLRRVTTLVNLNKRISRRLSTLFPHARGDFSREFDSTVAAHMNARPGPGRHWCGQTLQLRPAPST